MRPYLEEFVPGDLRKEQGIIIFAERSFGSDTQENPIEGMPIAEIGENHSPNPAKFFLPHLLSKRALP